MRWKKTSEKLTGAAELTVVQFAGGGWDCSGEEEGSQEKGRAGHHGGEVRP